MGKSFCRQLLVKKRQTYSVASILALSNNPEVVSQKLSFNTMRNVPEIHRKLRLYLRILKSLLSSILLVKKKARWERIFFIFYLLENLVTLTATCYYYSMLYVDTKTTVVSYSVPSQHLMVLNTGSVQYFGRARVCFRFV